MYDVYVNGVDPKRIWNLENIKKDIANELGIENQKLDQLCHSESTPVCFQKNLSKQAAIKICDKLSSLGLICYHRSNVKRSFGALSLVPIEKTDDVFTCPACKQHKSLNDKPEPKVCPHCNVVVEQYLREQAEWQEYEYIRKKLLRRSHEQLKTRVQNKLSEQERLRREALETKVADELDIEQPFEWRGTQPKKRYWGTISVAVMSLIGFGAYTYFPNPDFLASDIPEQLTAYQLDATLAESRMVEIPEQATVIGADADLPSQSDIINTKPTANFSTNDKQTPAQAASAKSHAEVMNFMNTIGSSAEVKNTKALATKHTELTASENKVFLDSIYREVNDDIEWDSFVKNKLKAQIKAGKLKSVYQLSQYQSHLTDHISIIGDLLTTFSKLGLNDLLEATVKTLTQHIRSQSTDLQAIGSAQLAAKLHELGKSSNLFDESERLALSLRDPIVKSQVLTKVAVYQKMAGQSSAENNLILAEDALKQANTEFRKFSGYIDLAHDFVKMDYHKNTELILTQAEGVLNGLDASQQQNGYAMLLDTAYLTNNSVLIAKYSNLVSPVYQSKALYQNIKWRLREELFPIITPQQPSITDLNFSSVAKSLAASLESDSGVQKDLLTTAQLHFSQIKDSGNKAVAASKVARYLHRLGREREAINLFEQALNETSLIIDTKQKDAVLIVLATDQARVFLTDNAEKIVSRIRNRHFKSGIDDVINTSKAIQATLGR
jgi:hypothetical protein